MLKLINIFNKGGDMRILITIVLSFVLIKGFFGCDIVLAQSKYGVVDMQHIILNVDEGKKERAKLEKEIKNKEAELEKSRKELEKLNEEWKSQVLVLSEEAKLKKQQEFQEKFLNLKNSEIEFQKEIKRKEQQATQKIAMKVVKIAEKIAKERGLDAVFEISTSGVLYLKNPIDITEDIIAQYETKKTPKQDTKSSTNKNSNKKN